MGEVELTLENPGSFTLALRVPGWAQGRPLPSGLYRYVDDNSHAVTLRVNGAVVDYDLEQGFARLTRNWSAGDFVALTLPMPVQRVVSSEDVVENRNKVAVQRGPLVFCAEEIDNGAHLAEQVFDAGSRLEAVFEPDLLGGTVMVRGELTLIPYYAWSHRGGEMAVWLRRDPVE